MRVTTRLVAGLGAEEARQLLHEYSDYAQAMGRVAQGIAVDLDQFKQHLSTLLNSPELRVSMGAAGRRRVESKYNWRGVIEEWKALAADLTARRHHAVAMGLQTPPQLPHWMPDTCTGFGCFASEVMPHSWTPSPPTPELERQRLSNRFQSWDQELLERDDARRRGWWLKQGLVRP